MNLRGTFYFTTEVFKAQYVPIWCFLVTFRYYSCKSCILSDIILFIIFSSLNETPVSFLQRWENDIDIRA